MIKKVWIYAREFGFRQVAPEKIDFGYPYTPPNMARYIYRKPNKWLYVHFADTREECWDRATAYARSHIDALNQKIAEAKADIIRHFGERETKNE